MFSGAVVHPNLLDGDPIDPITLIGETALDPGELLKVAVQEHLVPGALEPVSAESVISILQEKEDVEGLWSILKLKFRLPVPMTSVIRMLGLFTKVKSVQLGVV